MIFRGVPVPKYSGPWDRVVDKIPPSHLRANSNATYTFEGNGGTPKGTLFSRTWPRRNLLLTQLQRRRADVSRSRSLTYITGGNG